MLDDRDRQKKALDQWEKQTKQWAILTKKLAGYCGKNANDTLPATIHYYRQKVEECNIIEASVPQTMRNAENSWEMSLRKTDDSCAEDFGVRYVQIGIPYPYPLYCPVSDVSTNNPESLYMSHIVPEKPVSHRHKPFSDTEYYRTRVNQYRKFIQSKFSHFNPNQDALILKGEAPPVTKTLIREITPRDGVLYYPVSSNGQVNSTKTPLDEGFFKETTSSLLEGEGGIVQKTPTPPVAHVRDSCSLELSCTNLMQTVAPGELAQLLLFIDNTGDVAIFYNWITQQNKLTPCYADQNGPQFLLSDNDKDVILPGERKKFVFCLKPKFPGVFSKSVALVTVPSKKTPINVHLQVYCIDNRDCRDEMESLQAELRRRTTHDGAYTPISCIVSNHDKSDVLSIADYKRTRDALKALGNKPNVISTKENEDNRTKWFEHNNLCAEMLPPAVNQYLLIQQAEKEKKKDAQAELPHVEYASLPEKKTVPYNFNVYKNFKILYRNVQLIQSVCAEIAHKHAALNLTPTDVEGRGGKEDASKKGGEKPAIGSAKGAVFSPPKVVKIVTDARERNILQKFTTQKAVELFLQGFEDAMTFNDTTEKKIKGWDGSLRRLLEDIGHIRDGPLRNKFLSSISVLVRLSMYSDTEDECLGVLAARWAATEAFEEAHKSLQSYLSTSDELAQQKLRDASPVEKDKAGKHTKKGGSGTAVGKEKAMSIGGLGGGGGFEGDKELIPAKTVLQAEYFFNGGTRIGESILEVMKRKKRRALEACEGGCREAGVVTELNRLEIIRQMALQPQLDVDSVAEAQKKKH